VTFFTAEERASVRRRVLERAEEDPRIVAAAVVGAEAAGRVDRWSDLDLTFGVAESTSVEEVLNEWTGELATELEAVHLFDVHVGPTVYRVFLLPGNLQVDLSFTPTAQFGALGPNFRLLFGAAVEHRVREPMSRLAETSRQRFGLCVLYLVRARLGVERGDLEQAERYLRSASELLDEATPIPPATPSRATLLAAVQETLEVLLREPGEARDLAERLMPQLQELTRSTLDAG
jgi:hypothetical protein